MPRGTIALDSYVAGTLMRDLVGHDRRPAAFFVYLYVWAGNKHPRQSASYSEIASQTGLSKRTVQAAVRHLERRRLLAVERPRATAAPTYVALLPWQRRSGR
jgi:DNA-binding MarR family transcriptional regulator